MNLKEVSRLEFHCHDLIGNLQKKILLLDVLKDGDKTLWKMAMKIVKDNINLI